MSRLSDNDEDYCAWMSDSICCHGDSDYVGDYPLEEECMQCPYFEAAREEE